MSASREELILFLEEAEAKGDKKTANAVLDKIEALSSQPQAPVAQQGVSGARMSEFINEAGRQGFTAPNLQNKMIEGATGKELEPTQSVKDVGNFLKEWWDQEDFDITPQFVDDWWKQEKDSLAWIGETDFGKMMKRAIVAGEEKYTELRDTHPHEFAVAENAMMVRGLTSPLTRGKPGKAPVPKTDFLDDVVKRYQNKTELKAQVSRTDVNAIRSYNIRLDKEQAAVKGVMSKMKSITPMNTSQMNYNAVTQELGKTAQKLENTLIQAKIPVSIKDTRDAISKGLAKLAHSSRKARNPKALREARDAAMEEISKHPKTAAGLLQARKTIDAEFRSIKGERRMAGKLLPSMEEMHWRTVRDSLNNLIETKVPGVYKKSLEKQKILYDAREILLEKAAYERATVAGRQLQNVKQWFPDRTMTLTPRQY